MNAMQSTISGHFTLTVHGGRRGRMVLAEFDNLITDAGLNDIFASTSGSGCSRAVLGTGTTAPAVTDNALAVPGPATTTTQRGWSTTSPTYTAGPPDYTSDYTTLRFAVGVATGTWTEVGMTRDISPFILFSRALIVDSGGSPTSITVLADETLDVTYTMRVYPPTDDVLGSVTLEGTSHDFIIRPHQANAANWTAYRAVVVAGYAGRTATGALNTGIYDGAIGSRTAIGPSGASSSASVDLTASAYSSGSFQRSFEVKWDLNRANIAGGIKSMTITPKSASDYPGLGYQIEFTPKIPKTNTKILRLNFTAGFARRP